MSIVCRLFGHNTDTKVETDIVIKPWAFPKESMNGGFVRYEREKCTRCHKWLKTTPVDWDGGER